MALQITPASKGVAGAGWVNCSISGGNSPLSYSPCGSRLAVLVNLQSCKRDNVAFRSLQRRMATSKHHRLLVRSTLNFC